MTNFWDLPKPVREKIYRIKLVLNRPITQEKHHKVVNFRYKYDHSAKPKKYMPSLCHVSKKFDKEVAPIYYRENHFEFGSLFEAIEFARMTYPRHMRMVRRVTCALVDQGYRADDGFRAIGRMKGLQELYIRVNEKKMLGSMRNSRLQEQRWIHNLATSREQLVILQHAGMAGLLSLSGIQKVQFTRLRFGHGGTIPGGVLETYVLPRIMSRTPSISTESVLRHPLRSIWLMTL